MNDDKYIPSGKLMGDSAPMPDRGTKTGLDGDSYGCDLSQDAVNRTGSLTSAAKSDPMGEGHQDDPTFGPAPGDKAEDEKEGY